jgi:peptide deformylase
VVGDPILTAEGAKDLKGRRGNPADPRLGGSPSAELCQIGFAELARTEKLKKPVSYSMTGITRGRAELLPIRVLGDPVLREPAVEVEVFGEELQRLIQSMFRTMYDAEGAGLAAPQVGIGQRIVVIDVREAATGPVALINPRIVSRSADKEKFVEGCLSIPGISSPVERHRDVVVEAFTPAGTLMTLPGSGRLASVLQHEVDHLDGVLYLDRLAPLQRKMVLKKYQKLSTEEHQR